MRFSLLAAVPVQEAVIRMLENVRQSTIKLLILKVVRTGSDIFTDEYVIYSALTEWGSDFGSSAMEWAIMPGIRMETGFMRCM
jgi:hypothetical protein